MAYTEAEELVDREQLKGLSLGFLPATEYKPEEKDSQTAGTKTENLSPLQNNSESTDSSKTLKPQLKNLSSKEIVATLESQLQLTQKGIQSKKKQHFQISRKNLSPQVNEIKVSVGKDSAITKPTPKNESLESENTEETVVVDLENLSPQDILNIMVIWGKIEISIKGGKFEVEPIKERRNSKKEELLPPDLTPTSSRTGIHYRIVYTTCGKKCKCRSGKKHGGYLTVRWWEEGARHEKSLGKASSLGGTLA